nr:hypothetical protein BaRGS_029413 [Batillaria attramentaria]
MLTVCFTLLVAPLLVLADQELLLQIVTTNAPTAQVKAAYNGLNVVYGVKSTFFSYYGVDFPSDYPQLTNTEPLYFIEREVRFTGKNQEEMHAMLQTHFEQIAPKSSGSIFMSAAPVPHKLCTL